MSNPRNVLVVGDNAVLTGEIVSPGRVEVYGRLEGDITSDEVIVHKDAELKGRVRARGAKVSGAMNGEVRVKELISIAATGTVSGKLLYGRLAMDDGAELTATVRNVPPSLEGDFSLAVRRGGNVQLSAADLNAIDSDDAPERLTFSVADARGGFLARNANPKQPVTSFTQADINVGEIVFVHDGGGDARSSFDVLVQDAAGASAGPPKTVSVAVSG